MNIVPRKVWGGTGNQMFAFAYIYSQMRKGLIPDVYVQDPEYFDEFRNEIKQIFGAEIPEKLDMVAIHCRRTDYVNNPFYVDLSLTDYYERAMAEFPDEDFIVFSDDIEYCKSLPVFKGCEFSDEQEIGEMNLIASCTGQIIANSSFSFWGAYISPYSKKVVAPSPKTLWYGDEVIRTKVPKDWVVIER